MWEVVVVGWFLFGVGFVLWVLVWFFVSVVVCWWFFVDVCGVG